MDEFVQPGDLQRAHLVIHYSCRGNQTGSSCCHAFPASATCMTLLCDTAAGQRQEHGISAHDCAQIFPAAQCQSVPSCQVMMHSHIVCVPVSSLCCKRALRRSRQKLLSCMTDIALYQP